MIMTMKRWLTWPTFTLALNTTTEEPPTVSLDVNGIRNDLYGDGDNGGDGGGGGGDCNGDDSGGGSDNGDSINRIRINCSWCPTPTWPNIIVILSVKVIIDNDRELF